MVNCPFANSSDSLMESQDVGQWEETGQTIPSFQARISPNRQWEREGKRIVSQTKFCSPELLCFSCKQPAELNTLLLQGSGTKCSLPKPWAQAFLSATSERTNSTFPRLTQWTFLLQPCLINHRWYKHVENKHIQLSENTNKPGAVIKPLATRPSAEIYRLPSPHEASGLWNRASREEIKAKERANNFQETSCR